MAILGTNAYTRAIPLVGGGYSVSTAPKGNSNAITHSTVNVPKTSNYYKPPAPAAPKYVAPRAVTAPTASASIQTVAAPQAAPAPPPAPTLDDLINKYYAATQGDINTLYDKQNSQQLAALKSQQDTATANTKQDYYTKRNAADVVNAQNVQKLRELMASQGIAASGDNLTLNAKANSDRMNSLNTLNTQEQAALNDINNPSKAQAITNAIETARAQALLNAKQSAYNRAWGEYQYNNPSAYQQASLAMSKYNLDSTNAANSAANQAALDYYNSMGFNGSSGGGGTAASGNAAFNSNMTAAAKKAGIPSSWIPAMTEIARRESSWNPSALNKSSGTYGYAQFQPYNITSYNQKYGLDYRNSPVDQLVAMYHYITDRYGTAQNALNFWNSHSWY